MSDDRTRDAGLGAKVGQAATRAWHRSSGRLALRIVCAALACASVAFVTGGIASANTARSTRATETRAAAATERPTVVLVHGAWADASSWEGVTEGLQRDGFRVVAPPNPLRGLSEDAGYLENFLKTIPGPIVLVGHSYGGAVITNAATGNANVKALVYVDAFIPDQGEVIAQLSGAQSCLAGSAVDPTMVFNFVQDPALPPGDVDAYLKTGATALYEGFAKCFANGLSAREAAQLAAGQRPIAVGALAQPTGVPAWKTIRSWDLIGSDDLVIPQAQQLAMATRAGSTIRTFDGGHLGLIAHPADVVAIILDAIHATS